jgi:hypothetical protein
MARRPEPGSVDHLLDLLEEACTTEQVSALLRRFRTEDNKKELKITAPNKPDLIQQNLRRAISERAIPVEEAWNLLREAEENGSQHVFYYRPKSDAVAAAMADYDTIRNAILSGHGVQAGSIPRVPTTADSYALADCRLCAGPTTAGHKCVTKFYGSETYRERAGAERQEDGVILVPFKEVTSRTVMVAVLRAWGLLELRIPRMDSAPLVGRMLDQLRELIAPGIDLDDFSDWDLSPAKRRILTERDQHRTVYTVGATLLGDGDGGTALITPHGEEDDLFAAPARQSTVEAYLGDGCACRNLRVIWHAQEQADPPTERVTTIMGSTRKSAPPNELIATGRVSAGTMDYVAHRLRQFQGPAT